MNIKNFLPFILMIYMGFSYAQTKSYNVYIDRDNSMATGCTVLQPDFMTQFDGIDGYIAIEIGSSPVAITSSLYHECQSNVFDGGSAIVTSALGLNTNINGDDVFEMEMSTLDLGIRTSTAVKLYYTSESATSSDIVVVNNSGGGIFFGVAFPIPTLSFLSLLLLSLVVFIVARKAYKNKVLIFASVMMFSTVVWGMFAFVIDGDVSDWSSFTAINDPLGDNSGAGNFSDITQVFGNLEQDLFTARIDVVDVENQAPTITSSATADAIENGKGYREIEGVNNLVDFPKSSEEMKTIRYTQKNVHDFAWFADKRYSVLKSEVELPHSKRKVTTWAMYTPKNAKTKWTDLWIKASEYLNDAIYYYSLWNGDYPYNQVTAVDGTISAGGGMEYPNVTVIGNSSSAHELEVVIVHEVGHNWFYGQLGSNERVHGWMDEGMNTLNEIRYMQTKYPNNTALSDMILGGKLHMDRLSHHDMADISYRAIAGIGEDQPIETHSNDFTSMNYGIVMYQKTGLVFFYLKDYLGEELFDQAMHAYYSQWEFKHPQPEDMKKSLEDATGKDLSWIFKDLIQTTNHVDYKIKRVRKTKHGYNVKVKNVGQVD
ncbi:MAG: hypothetical protein L3J83_01895, partial [Proteobacteria bacterium]|nr:hypothetical protein [Pseudomonadota bacterium]